MHSELIGEVVVEQEANANACYVTLTLKGLTS